MICSLDRKKLTSWIFEKLLDQINHQQSDTDIDRIRTKISEIMEYRRDKDSEKTDLPLTLMDLPNVLFPEISSFLSFEEQTDFERTNRSIFIGTRSSSLPMHLMTDIVFANLVRYRAKNPQHILREFRFDSLSIDCDYLGHHDEDHWDEPWILYNKSIKLEIIEKVESLTISSCDDESLCAVLDSYILNQSESFQNIKKLSIEADEYKIIRDIEPSLNTLVSRCSDLEYFEMHGMYFEDADFAEYEWVSNLKGIAADVCDEEDYRKISPLSVKIYSALSSKVESLHLASLSIVNALNCNLSNLKELCLNDIPSAGVFGVNSYRFLLKQNMTKLKRVNYSCSAWKKQIEEDHVMMLWMKKMLKSVEYFCVKFEDTEILRIMEVVQSVLSDYSATGRSLKLRFNHKPRGKWSRGKATYIWKRFERIYELFEVLKRLLVAFELRHFDWMVIVHRLSIQKDQRVEVVESSNALRKINGYRVDLKWKEYESHRAVDIVIRGNQNHGIQEKWDMNCCNCPSQTVIFK